MEERATQGDDLATLDRFYGSLFNRYGDQKAITTAEEVLSYADFDERTAKLANFFQSIGLGSGDPVGILSQNRTEYLTALIAAARAGIVAVPLNASSGLDRLKYIFRDADLEALVVGPALAETGHEIQQSDIDVGYLIGVGHDDDLPLGFHSFETILERADDTPPSVTTYPDDIAAIYYTSGTTADPKGTLHNHEAIILNIYAHHFELEIQRDDRVLLVTPLGHSAGFFAMAALAQGAEIVLERGFDPEMVVERVTEDAISWTYLIPTMISELLEFTRDAETNFESLDTLVYGSAPLSPSKVVQGIEAFGDVFIQFYGLTEIPNLVTVLPKGRHTSDDDQWLHSTGRPARLADVTVLTDENDWDDDIGEIGIRATYQMTGYLNDQHECTADRRWIRTGDIGRIDEKGRLHVLDRVQNTIIVNGEPVFSTEVENVIEQHEGIAKVGVIGIPVRKPAVPNPAPQQVEQSIKAIVVPADEGMVSPPELEEYCRDQLPERERPDSIDTVGDLPETPYGKVDKQLLREPYW